MTQPTPPGNVPKKGTYEDRMAALEKRLASVEQKGATRLGRTTVVDPDGNDVIYVGPDTNGNIRPDGQTPWQIKMHRDGGALIMNTMVTTDAVKRQYWGFYDSANHLIMSDDANSGIGLATPWIPIVLYPLFNTTANTTFDYPSLDAAQLGTTQRAVWEGRIPMVTHPYLELDGVWGRGSGTPNITYQVLLNSTLVGTPWALGSLQVGRQGPFDITNFYGQQWVKIQITAQITNGATSGACALGLLGCALRQSP